MKETRSLDMHQKYYIRSRCSKSQETYKLGGTGDLCPPQDFAANQKVPRRQTMETRLKIEEVQMVTILLLYDAKLNL